MRFPAMVSAPALTDSVAVFNLSLVATIPDSLRHHSPSDVRLHQGAEASCSAPFSAIARSSRRAANLNFSCWRLQATIHDCRR